MARPAVDPLVRFFAKIEPDPNSGCWLWASILDQSGYGSFYGADRRKVGAHRFSYEAHKGPIPEGKNVCHSCDVRPCVNPDHLWLGSQKDNLADMKAKRRNPKGFSHHSAKITPESLAGIRQMLKDGFRQSIIASRFGLSVSSISHIKQGRTHAGILP